MHYILCNLKLRNIYSNPKDKRKNINILSPHPDLNLYHQILMETQMETQCATETQYYDSGIQHPLFSDFQDKKITKYDALRWLCNKICFRVNTVGARIPNI